VSQPHFGLSVRVKPTLPKVGTWSPTGLPKTQSSISGVKSPRIWVFLVSLERSWSVDVQNVQNVLALVIWTFPAQVMGKKGREKNWQFDSRPLKVGNRPVPNVRSGSATWRWKALFKGYKFGSDLIPIGGQGEELQSPKVPRVQTGTVSRLHFGSPGKKSHSDATPVGEHMVYYREYGVGISRARAVVCLVSPS
jgi:hypothetical protein